MAWTSQNVSIMKGGKKGETFCSRKGTKQKWRPIAASAQKRKSPHCSKKYFGGKQTNSLSVKMVLWLHRYCSLDIRAAGWDMVSPTYDEIVQKHTQLVWANSSLLVNLGVYGCSSVIQLSYKFEIFPRMKLGEILKIELTLKQNRLIVPFYTCHLSCYNVLTLTGN